jgi:hypothetical protein
MLLYVIFGEWRRKACGLWTRRLVHEVWINVVDGRPPQSKHVRGIDQERGRLAARAVGADGRVGRGDGCPRAFLLCKAVVTVPGPAGNLD